MHTCGGRSVFPKIPNMSRTRTFFKKTVTGGVTCSFLPCFFIGALWGRGDRGDAGRYVARVPKLFSFGPGRVPRLFICV